MHEKSSINDGKMPTLASPLPTSPSMSQSTASKDLDVAFNYIQNANDGGNDFQSVNLATLRRKIDWRIVPIMFLCYTMQFLDKVNINVCYLLSSTTISTKKLKSCSMLPSWA